VNNTGTKKVSITK